MGRAGAGRSVLGRGVQRPHDLPSSGVTGRDPREADDGGRGQLGDQGDHLGEAEGSRDGPVALIAELVLPGGGGRAVGLGEDLEGVLIEAAHEGRHPVGGDGPVGGGEAVEQVGRVHGRGLSVVGGAPC